MIKQLNSRLIKNTIWDSFRNSLFKSSRTSFHFTVWGSVYGYIWARSKNSINISVRDSILTTIERQLTK